MNRSAKVERSESAFDHQEYLRIIDSRGSFIKTAMERLKPELQLETALDAGAGLGFFSKVLQDAGLRVKAFDGREENVMEAMRRFPDVEMVTGDIQDRAICALGRFDLVLCFGLLYHLEAPLQALRHLNALTEKALLLESMCLPETAPWMLLREEPNQEDQSLTDVAFYPSEGCIVKMIYRAGFSHVYSFTVMPDHEHFRESRERKKRRTILLATRKALNINGIVLRPEPTAAGDPWQKSFSQVARGGALIQKFLAKSPRGKYAGVARRWLRKFPSSVVPLRLQFGAWWLARGGTVDERLLDGTFETAELNFVQNYLQKGMTVLDIGAHHGLYTMLASRLVGGSGKVFAFEPSPRERARLERHLRLNSCKNVKVERVAVASDSGTVELFVVDGAENGCNSLRPPVIAEKTTPIRVQTIALDEWLEKQGNPQVDFIKLDVEGGELEVLKGAEALLTRQPRPVMFVEVQDTRTRPWGYAAREITLELNKKGYRWFQISDEGKLIEITADLANYDGNFVACPEERIESIGKFVNDRAAGS